MARLQLLLVDPDPRSQRLTAAGLARNGFTVTSVSTADEALDRLRAHPVDGVLCAASVPGDGAAAVREAVRGGLEEPPFVLLVDGAEGALSRWEPLAPVEVVARPVALGDLVARVRGALDAAVRRRLEAGAEQAFHSSVDRMSLLDVVEFFRAHGRSGTVTFSGAREGRLVFHAGAPVDAVAGVQSGKEAFFRLLAAREGTYDLKVEPTSPEGNVAAPAEELLDEGIAYLEAWDRALEQVPPLDSALEQDAVRVAELQGALPDEAGWILRLVDGERTVEDLVEASTLGGLAVLEILARLYFEGLVSVRTGMSLPARRPRVDEWLNSPPSLPREPAGAPLPAPAAGGRPHGASARTTQPLSPTERDSLEQVAPDAPGAAEPQVASGEDREAFAAVMHPSEAAPSARTTQVLSLEELEALAAVAGPPEPPAVPDPPESEGPLPGFADEGGFPMGSAGGTLQQGAVGAVPFHVTPTFPGADVPPRPVAGAHETGRGPALDGDVPPAPPSVETAPEAVVDSSPPGTPELPPPEVATAPPPRPAAAVPSSSPSSVDSEDDLEFVPVKRSWGFAAAAAGGLLLLGLATYFGTGTSASSPEPAAVVAPPPLAQAEAEKPAEPALPDGLDADAEPLIAEAPQPAAAAPAETAPPTSAPPSAAAPAVAGPAPAPLAADPPAPVAAPAVGTAPPPPAALPPQPPVAQAAAAVQSPAAAPVARAAPPKAPAPEFDLSRVTTPPLQGATAQDRLAPGLLPRKASRPSVATPQQAVTPAPPPGGGGATAAATVLKGAKRAQVLGNWSAAVEGYRKALALGADTPDVKAGLGISLVSSDPGLRGYQEATELLKQSLAQDGGNANAWLSLGMAYQFTGNNAEAVKAYERYLALAPAGKSAAEVRAMLERL